jgi:hypothetical protein
VTTNAVKGCWQKATIDLTQTLPFATAISVTVTAGAFEDERATTLPVLLLVAGRLLPLMPRLLLT